MHGVRFSFQSVAIRFVTALLLFAATAVTASAAVDSAARALLPDDVRDKGTLVAGMPLDFEPFNFIDDGQQTGLDVEILRAIADVLGLKTDIQRMSFASLIPAVTGGRVDVAMSAMGILKPRLTVVSFVRYGVLTSGLVVRKGNPTGVRTDGDNCGRTIVVEKGTNTQFLWESKVKRCADEGKPKLDLMIIEGKGPQVLAVEGGRAEAAGFSYATAMITAQHSGGRLEAAPGGPVAGGTTDAGIAFRRDRVKLGQAMEAALKQVVADGTYDRIFSKWKLSSDRATPLLVSE
jgi:polar amino acid transport system substrate-binding protein